MRLRAVSRTRNNRLVRKKNEKNVLVRFTTGLPVLPCVPVLSNTNKRVRTLMKDVELTVLNDKEKILRHNAAKLLRL